MLSITNPRFFALSLPYTIFFLHRLQVVRLLDLGPSLLAHSLPQFLPLLRRGEVVQHAAVLLAGQVHRLLLQRYLWRQGLEVAFSEELCFEGLLALGREFSLFLGFCYKGRQKSQRFCGPFMILKEVWKREMRVERQTYRIRRPDCHPLRRPSS